ncbi:histidine kinase [Diaphorobacter sp. NR2-3-3-1]|nr:histidine kinase [Diaphorobacter caeni]
MLPAWLLLSITTIALVILSPALLSQPDRGVQIGGQTQAQLFIDEEGRFDIDDVAALPNTSFTTLSGPLNKGYSSSVHWLKVAAPKIPLDPHTGTDDGLWLSILPSYLDEVQLYQFDGQHWLQRRSGDTVPMASRIQVRQLLFPLLPDRPFYLRVQTTSPVSLDARVWRASLLLTQFSTVEWASGVHQGINLVLVLLIIGAALVLRKRSLAALAVGATTTLIHGAADRGYLQLWLPADLAYWGDAAVKIGTLVLPIAIAWQFRELLTIHSRWKRVDKLLLLAGIAPLLCLPSIPLDFYQDVAWVGIIAPWVISTLFAYVAWGNLIKDGPSMETLLMILPTTLYGMTGMYVVGVYMGYVSPPEIETSILWQLKSLLTNLLVAVAVGARLFHRFGESMERQSQLVESLEKSEQTLEERVRLRTDELLHTRNALQHALHNEREMRNEQRQFFNMINHEFRTPLAVVDSAAAEQQTFPSDDLQTQVARAVQIRRACKRLDTLVANSLLNDRLDTTAFAPQLMSVPIEDLVADAAQLVQWSQRHQLGFDIAEELSDWHCDQMLVSIALSNLADNAIKYAQAGRILIQARIDERGRLELSVSDEGPGMSLQSVERIFERYERGNHADQARGFGLGLWVARRIARQHGGDVKVSASTMGGTRFTLTLARGMHRAGKA